VVAMAARRLPRESWTKSRSGFGAVPPRCFFCLDSIPFLSPPKVNFLYRNQRLQQGHTMCCKCTAITLQTESGSVSGCARGREGRQLMRARSFFFCSRPRANHGISSVVNAREGMSQFEPGSHPDARAGGWGRGPINEAAVGCGLFLFILFLQADPWGWRGRARFLFVVG
jgi:hypothetical protein